MDDEARRPQQVEAERCSIDERRTTMRYVGKLAGGIAHDYNNLLGVIMNYIAFVEEDLANDAVAACDDLRSATEAARRAADLTRRLRLFSRTEVGRADSVDVNAVVAAIEPLLRDALGEGVALELSLAPDLPPANGASPQLEHVLIELARNAGEAVAETGRVEIRTEQREVSPEASEAEQLEPGRYVCVAVSDDGAGMAKEILDRALDPFFTTKTTGDGRGLGLPTAHSVVCQLDGDLRLLSAPDAGTTAVVHLPARVPEDEAEPTAASARASTTPEPQSTSVLVVDDEPGVREVARRILDRAGYRVSVACDARQALELASTAESFDLLLTDVVMPGMSGCELAAEIAAQRSLPVLYMSGYTGDELERHGVRERELRLVEKPFTRGALLEAVRAAIADPAV